jgi:AraC-like DNA-binding protein
MTAKRKLLILGSILAACAFAGGAYAATSDTSPRQAFLNDVAKRLHVTPQQLRSAVDGATQDQLNAAVRAGRLTQAQANAIEKRLREGAFPPGPFFGPRLRHRLFFGGRLLGTAANYIGVTPAQLFQQLGSGKSLAKIATAHGKSVSGLESTLLSAERTRLDRARQDGFITSAQEQRLLERVQQKISALINQAGFAPRLRALAAPPPFFGPRVGPASVPPGFPPPAAAAPLG